jgi:hypothetical protein
MLRMPHAVSRVALGATTAMFSVSRRPSRRSFATPDAKNIPLIQQLLKQN